jgi:anti-anti-sigma factor
MRVSERTALDPGPRTSVRFMHHDITPYDIPSGDGDRPAGPDSTGHLRWSSPVSAALEWDVSDDTLTVRLVGDVCTWSVSRMQPVLDALVLSVGPRGASIDLSAVRFFDARGVSMLVELAERARQAQRSFRIVDASEAARRVLTMCGFGLVRDLDLARRPPA